MSLLNDLKSVCDRLAPLGWRDLLKAATKGDLDIAQPTAEKLKAVLLATLPAIDRTVPGFEDFAGDGRQGITPGRPSHSLLYHAVASPQVTRDAEGSPMAG